MVVKSFFKRILPFTLTAMLGIITTGFFVSASAPATALSVNENNEPHSCWRSKRIRQAKWRARRQEQNPDFENLVPPPPPLAPESR